ncbi:MAG: GerMN domain-containing protein [Chloroflexi bacterium]|nr:GerMN domain-containing protein [Chloroflexota bacterium]
MNITVYNVFYQSDLRIDGIDIEEGQALIALSGTLTLGSVYDNPRVLAQLEQTALQFATVSAVTTTVNGQPLESLLSEQ